MSRPDSVLHAADLRQIGSQQREKLTDFVVKLPGDSGMFTTPWHGFSDATSIVTSMSRSSLVLASSIDRKSTRLNSSHVSISYAVFCLKKKTDSARVS